MAHDWNVVSKNGDVRCCSIIDPASIAHPPPLLYSGHAKFFAVRP